MDDLVVFIDDYCNRHVYSNAQPVFGFVYAVEGLDIEGHVFDLIESLKHATQSEFKGFPGNDSRLAAFAGTGKAFGSYGVFSEIIRVYVG
jgi:hypothetical protein